MKKITIYGQAITILLLLQATICFALYAPYAVKVRFSGCVPVQGWVDDYTCIISTTEDGFGGKDYTLSRSLKSWPIVSWTCKKSGGAYTTRWPAYYWPDPEMDTTSGVEIRLETTDYGFRLRATSASESVPPNMGAAGYFYGELHRSIIDGNTANELCRCCDASWYIPPWTAFTDGTARLTTLKTDFKTFSALAEDWKTARDCDDLQVFCECWQEEN